MASGWKPNLGEYDKPETNPKHISCKAIKITFTHQRKGTFPWE